MAFIFIFYFYSKMHAFYSIEIYSCLPIFPNQCIQIWSPSDFTPPAQFQPLFCRLPCAVYGLPFVVLCLQGHPFLVWVFLLGCGLEWGFLGWSIFIYIYGFFFPNFRRSPISIATVVIHSVTQLLTVRTSKKKPLRGPYFTLFILNFFFTVIWFSMC